MSFWGTRLNGAPIADKELFLAIKKHMPFAFHSSFMFEFSAMMNARYRGRDDMLSLITDKQVLEFLLMNYNDSIDLCLDKGLKNGVITCDIIQKSIHFIFTNRSDVLRAMESEFKDFVNMEIQFLANYCSSQEEPSMLLRACGAIETLDFVMNGAHNAHFNLPVDYVSRSIFMVLQKIVKLREGYNEQHEITEIETQGNFEDMETTIISACKVYAYLARIDRQWWISTSSKIPLHTLLGRILVLGFKNIEANVLHLVYTLIRCDESRSMLPAWKEELPWISRECKRIAEMDFRECTSSSFNAYFEFFTAISWYFTFEIDVNVGRMMTFFAMKSLASDFTLPNEAEKYQIAMSLTGTPLVRDMCRKSGMNKQVTVLLARGNLCNEKGTVAMLGVLGTLINLAHDNESKELFSKFLAQKYLREVGIDAAFNLMLNPFERISKRLG